MQKEDKDLLVLMTLSPLPRCSWWLKRAGIHCA